MSIQSEINRIISARDSSFTAVAAKGVTVPSDSTIDDLPGLIEEIQGTPSLQSKSVEPLESIQIVTADSAYDGLSSVTVTAIDSSYVGSNIPQRTSANLSASGSIVTAPAGYYSSQAIKAVASGSLTDLIWARPSLDWMITSNGVVSIHSEEVMIPQYNIINTAGYFDIGSLSDTITVRTAPTNPSFQLPVKAAATYTPTTTNQTIASEQYLTGAQTISGDADLIASNIKKDVNIFNVTGTFEGFLAGRAILHVNAENGSTITFTKNSIVVKTLTSDSGYSNSDGTTLDFYYSIDSNNYGDWTITASKSGSNITASKTITINSAKQYDIKLLYRIYLYNYGDLCTSITGGWTTVTSSYGSVTYDTNRIKVTGGQGSRATRTTNTITRGNYTKLCLLCTNTAAESATSSFGITSVTSGLNDRAKFHAWLNPTGAKYTEETLLTLNIDTFNGEYYVACNVYLKTVYIYQIYLDP